MHNTHPRLTGFPYPGDSVNSPYLPPGENKGPIEYRPNARLTMVLIELNAKQLLQKSKDKLGGKFKALRDLYILTGFELRYRGSHFINDAETKLKEKLMKLGLLSAEEIASFREVDWKNMQEKNWLMLMGLEAKDIDLNLNGDKFDFAFGSRNNMVEHYLLELIRDLEFDDPRFRGVFSYDNRKVKYFEISSEGMEILRAKVESEIAASNSCHSFLNSAHCRLKPCRPSKFSF